MLQPPPARDYPTLIELIEAVDAAIKASRGGKRTVDKGERGGRRKARQRKQKGSEVDVVAEMDADIKIFNANMDEIHDDIKDIIIRQTATRTATKKTTTTSAPSAIIKATVKNVIEVSDDGDFDANGGDDAASDDDWMYD